MASASVYYKFKSQRDTSRITFDGTGISVWDLKREIILQNKMGKGVDFDLALYNADTEDEYKDDKAIVPRSSQVVVRRLPPSKPGRGNAAQYVSDLQGGGPNSNVEERSQAPEARRAPVHHGQMSMRFDGRADAISTAGASGSGSTATGTISAPQLQSMSSGLEGDEASRIAAMFQATSEQWDETQERMAHATYRERPGAPRRPPRPHPNPNVTPNAAFHPSPAHDRPPPIGYICFRCGQKGHWIHDCPTNDDRDFDNKPRFKRTTGIPKSMLKTVEAPTDGVHHEGIMVTADGSYVVAQVDSASWARNQAHLQKRLTRSDVFSSVPSNVKLACSLCNKLLKDAVQTPCCHTLFCQECITTHLLEHEFQCPECEKSVRDLSELQRDDEIRKQVREYVDAEMDNSERKLQEAEQAEQDEIDKERKKREEVERKEAGLDEETTIGEQGVDSPAGDEGEREKCVKSEGDVNDLEETSALDTGEENNAQNDGSKSAWNGQAVQRIMMMLCNPHLPPPMRLQLQMQLRFLHNQFLQSQALQQNVQTAVHQQQQQAQMQQAQQGAIGAHNTNPFAGQHQMPMMSGNPFIVSTNGMIGNPMMGMQFASQTAAAVAKFHPVAPLSHQESAYMRLPVNPNKRPTATKRERPADFLELGGGGEPNKEARLS